MKKNKAMRAAGVLLIATLLTTCLTAGTFAKYTTTDSASDTARVAKFGVTVVANGSLYGTAYNAANGNTPVIATNDNGDTITVNTSDTDKVVAPGTKNDSGLGFAVNGKPEVDVQLTGTVKAENIFLAAGKYGVMTKVPAGTVTAENFANKTYFVKNQVYTKATEFAANTTYYVLKDTAEVEANTVYYPVVYKLAGVTAYNTGDTTKDTVNQIAAAVAAKFDSNAVDEDSSVAGSKYTFTKVVKNNTDLNADLALGSEIITWEWTYNVDDETDAKDTILGDLIAQKKADAAFTANGEVVKYTETTTGDVTNYTVSAPVEGTDYNLKTSFDITITATQID